MRELTTQELDLVAGGLDIESNFARINIAQKVVSIGIAVGHVATAEASAYGKGTATDTNTETSPYSSQSSSVSVTGGSYFSY